MKDQYEKVLLGVGAVIAIVMVVLCVLKLGKLEEHFPEATENPKGSIVIEAERDIDTSISTLSKPLSMGDQSTAKGRVVDVFTGVNLYVRRGASETVDIEDPAQKPVHDPIPNEWWLANGLGDEIGFGDAPQLDFDNDGFSNREEFDEKTHPNDKNSFPSLFAKLRLASIDKEQVLLSFQDFGGGALSFRIKGTVEQGKRLVENRMRGGKAVQPGELFFAEEPYKGRFKFVEKIEKVVNGIPKAFAKVEDLKPGKGNRIYELARSNKIPQNDYTARLFLDTPDQRENKFAVEEGMSFSIPFDKDATEKPYTLKEIGSDGTTALLLWENNGETTPLELKVEN